MLKYKININNIDTGTTATTINVPLSMEFQVVDQGELIERVFVPIEVEKAINPILDYEKVRFLPLSPTGIPINRISYVLDLNGSTTYADVGFNDEDIRFNRNNFKYTFINLAFYDTDNPMTQKLVSNITVYSSVKQGDLTSVSVSGETIGLPKPANQIELEFPVENPILNPNGFGEGFYIYDYKDELNIGDTKYLYMRASFKNAKNGKTTNLMVKSVPNTIDVLVHELYTRVKMTRTSTGFYYEYDNSYQGDGTSAPNNVIYVGNNTTISLYQIISL